MNALLTVDDKLSCLVAARWVRDQVGQAEEAIPAVAHLLETMVARLRGLSEPVFFFSLWFEFQLEVLVIPPCASRYALLASDTLFKELAPEAVRMLGAAIAKEMERSSNDLLVHEDDGGTEVLVFYHSVRATIEQATGVVLPERPL